MLPALTLRETSSTGQTGLSEGSRDEDGEGMKLGGSCWEHHLKDWFKGSRVTTALHHPIRPLFHRAGRAGQGCVFVGIVHPLQKKKKKHKRKKTTKVGKGGSQEKPTVLCFSVRCHCEFKNLSHLLGAKRILEGVGGEARNSHLSRPGVWRLCPKPNQLQTDSNETTIISQ